MTIMINILFVAGLWKNTYAGQGCKLRLRYGLADMSVQY